MSFTRGRLRRLIPGIAALSLITTLFFVARLPEASADEKKQIASAYKFTELPITMPPGYTPTQTIRQVNPAYKKIQSWISSVGANIAIGDLDGKGLDDAMCIVDPRTDQTVITYTPTAPTSAHFTPFVLDASPLPMDSHMAPTGCAFGDFTGDGRQGILVTYMGRTPILFLAKSNATGVAASSYRPVELVQQTSIDGLYHGPRWQTTSINVADYDGDGHPDIFIGNYFPDSDVLDPQGENNVQMNSSMSSARNGGGDRILRWHDARPGPEPTINYIEQRDALPFHDSTGWTLAIATADLTGVGLPDMYVANDFGNDHMFHNVSTPGRIRFNTVEGERTPTTPKSFVMGRDSFKGMAADFGDINGTGRFDLVVSNIATSYGIEESNFVWINQAKNNADMKSALDSGHVPFVQKAAEYGMAWNGWSWDVKMGDFRNSGKPDVVQTNGFVKGDINRWPWLQELAMSNDDLMSNPAMWPNARVGDDIGGSQRMAFYAPDKDGHYVNISKELGLAVPIPTRGVATGDTTGKGALDFAVARQWGEPAFYCNESPNRGDYLGLQLYRPSSDPTAVPGQNLAGIGGTAYGATVQISYPGHTQISQLDGGSGHAGHRSFEVNFGLGSYMGPVSVHIQWRDVNGGLHEQTQSLNPGTHNLLLTNTVQEVSGR